MKRWASFFVGLLLASCNQAGEVDGYEGLVKQVERGSVGSATDQWIEMLNMSGEWERIGLIFGYMDDYSECMKAIAGLKAENFAREYRCSPANFPRPK